MASSVAHSNAPCRFQSHYHTTLLLLLVLLLLFTTWRRPAALAGLLGAALLFALPSFFVNTAVFGGWPQALLAYPRMYAALLLWALLMIQVAYTPADLVQ